MSFDSPAPGSAFDITRTVLARLLPDAPRIDGRLDDEVWQKAASLGTLYRVGTSRPAPLDTRVFVGHFQDVLYVGVQCEEPDPQRRTGPWFQLRDRRIWNDDVIEILLDSRHDRRTVRAVVVNPAGAVADYLVAGPQKDLGWNSGCVAAAAETESGWAVEVGIPRSSLAEPVNDVIGFNVVRRRPGTEGEPFFWNPAPEFFEHGGWLGNLSFETQPCSIQKVEVGWPRVGRNRIRIWLRNGTDKDQRLRAGIVTHRMDDKVDRSRYRFTLPAGKVVQYGFTHRIGAPGPCNLAFMVMEDASGRPIAQFTRPSLNVERSALVLEKVAPQGGEEIVRMRFSVFVPRRDLAEVTLKAMARRSGAFATVAKATQKALPSRSGEIAISVGDLAEGEYELAVYLSSEGRVFARAIEKFSIPPMPPQ